MAIYSYRATTLEGKIIEGLIEASDEKTVMERLKSTGAIPLKVSAPGSLKKSLSLRSSKGDVLIFTTELSALLSAGLPLDRSLNILADISDNKEIKNITQAILKSIREGGSFSEALARHPKVFSRLYINMIKAGEAGGILDVVLDKLTEFLESTRELKEYVVSAMIYPVILAVTGSISIIILLTYVLPKFTIIFAEMGSSLPLSTQVLLTVSNTMKTYWWLILPVAAAGVFILRNYIKTEAGRYKWDAFKLKVMGDVITKLETARFCRTLGTLIKSGVPLLQALNNAKDVITNSAIASAIDAVSKGAKEGKGIAAPLSEAKIFPSLAMSMIKVGEETGQLDVMLIKVATAYEKNLRVSVKKFMGFFEPIMILVMGIVIGFIVISMLMAIFSITDVPF